MEKILLVKNYRRTSFDPRLYPCIDVYELYKDDSGNLCVYQFDAIEGCHDFSCLKEIIKKAKSKYKNGVVRNELPYIPPKNNYRKMTAFDDLEYNSLDEFYYQ
tara:strand:- start:7752 stop:8060 length:309 start_codon:yes stop_codon:yes gene_type:complete